LSDSWQRWCTTGINDDTRSSSGHQTNATRSGGMPRRRHQANHPVQHSCYTVIGITKMIIGAVTYVIIDQDVSDDVNSAFTSRLPA
jgi:hypothetical protein